MSNNEENILKRIKPSRIILPIIIGLIVVGYIFFKEFDYNALTAIKFTFYSFLWILISIFLMILRDLGYIIRLRILSDNKLTWKKSHITGYENIQI